MSALENPVDEFRKRSLPLWAVALALSGLLLLIYWPALRGGFIMDDQMLISENPHMQPGKPVSYFWLRPDLNEWLPVTYSGFWLQRQIFGNDTLGYHLVNLSLHCAAALLVWRCLLELAVPGALAIAVLFALHPVNVYSAAWICEEKNTLSTVLLGISTLCFLKYDRLGGRWMYAVSLTAFFIGWLSKTAGVGLPLVLLACLAWRHGKIRKVDLWRIAPMVLLSIAFVFTTLFIHRRNNAGFVIWPESNLARPLSAARAMWFYVGKILFPWPLMFNYPKWTNELTNWRTHLPLVAGLTAAGGLLCLPRRLRRATIFSAVVFLLFIGPVLGLVMIYFHRFSLVWNHWAYLATIPLIAGMVALIGQWVRRIRLAGMMLFILACLGLGISAHHEARSFADSKTFFTRAVQDNPTAWMPRANLAHALLLHDPAQAVTILQDLRRIEPNEGSVVNNLAVALERTGRIDEAIATNEALLRLQPKGVNAHWRLGRIAEKRGELLVAADHYRQVLLREPGHVAANVDLAMIGLHTGHVPEALKRCQNTVAANPSSAKAWAGLAQCYHTLNKSEAISAAEKSLQLNPDEVGALDVLGVIRANRGENARAIELFTRITQLEPQAQTFHYLAVLYNKEGRRGEAIAADREALRLQPAFTKAQAHLQSMGVTTQP